MQRNLLFVIAFIGLTLTTLCSCGGNSATKETEETEGTEIGNYRDAVRKGDFDTARDILAKYREVYYEESSKNGILNRDERKEAEKKYYAAFDYIYKSEVQYLLSELDGDECIDKVTFLLEDIPVEGEKFPQGLCEYSIARRGGWGDEGIPLDQYIVWTQHFNRLCNNILSLAINRKNQKLAELIVSKFVDNVEATTGSGNGDKVVDGVKIDGNSGYIKYTSTDRDAAKKKYDEAVKNGAFE